MDDDQINHYYEMGAESKRKEIESLQATVQELTLHNGKLGREVKDLEAKNELLKQVEANLCELHNIALAELTDSQHKVKVLSDALEEIKQVRVIPAVIYGIAHKALATVKEK